jgi:hypothetical protein
MNLRFVNFGKLTTLGLTLLSPGLVVVIFYVTDSIRFGAKLPQEFIDGSVLSIAGIAVILLDYHVSTLEFTKARLTVSYPFFPIRSRRIPFERILWAEGRVTKNSFELRVRTREGKDFLLSKWGARKPAEEALAAIKSQSRIPTTFDD